MELHQVRYFLAICKEKSFTRAAKHCGVSQPSLSNAIRRLEQELGGQLFHRNCVNCLLSELGREVWPHLAKLDQCARDARRQAAQFLTQRASATALLAAHLANPQGAGLLRPSSTRSAFESQPGRDGEQDGSAADSNRSVAFDQFPPASESEPSWHQIRARSGNDRSAELIPAAEDRRLSI